MNSALWTYHGQPGHWRTHRDLSGQITGFSRDIHYCVNRDEIFGCTKPIVDSLYEVLHNGHDGEVANAPPGKQPGLKADFRKFGSERFLAGPNRIQLTHLGQILFQQHVFKARELVCGVHDGLNWQSSRSNLREAKRVLVLAEKLTVDILVPVDDPFIEIHWLRACRGKLLLVQQHNSFFHPFHPIQWILPCAIHPIRVHLKEDQRWICLLGNDFVYEFVAEFLELLKVVVIVESHATLFCQVANLLNSSHLCRT